MISCIISCMNRTDRLEQMLPTWLKVEHIGEIIVVDWSSEIPILKSDIISNLLKNNDKLKIIRVNGEKYYNVGRAANLAFKVTDKKYKILMKLDVDYVNINDTWIDTLRITPGKRLSNYFIIGSYKFYPSSVGFLLINKIDFIKANGFNEKFEGWGFEDYDLFNRVLENTKNERYLNGLRGFKCIEFFNIKNYIHHIPHDDELRTANYKIKEKSESNSINKNIALKNKQIRNKDIKFKIQKSFKNYSEITYDYE